MLAVDAKIEREIFPLEITTLSELFQKKASAQLHETPEMKIQCLEEMKKIIKNDLSMREDNFNEDFLIRFLRAKKYNVHKAFFQLKSLLDLKRKNQHLFNNYLLDDMLKFLNNFTLLPWRCHDGCAIIYIDIEDWNPAEFPMEEVQKMTLILLLQSLRYPMTQVNGIKAIYNLKTTFSISLLKLVTLQNLRFFTEGILKCVPIRYKAVHVINNSIVCKALWMVMNPLLPEKIRKRVFFHSSKEELLNYFPREVLPLKFGGSLENYDMSKWFQEMTRPEELENMMGGKQPDVKDLAVY